MESTHAFDALTDGAAAHSAAAGDGPAPLVVDGATLSPTVSTLPQEPAFLQHDHATYTPFTAYCFTVNYILGVGVLGMPFGFVKAGWFLSTVTLFLITAFSWVTGLWIVQVQQRAKLNIHQQYQQQQRRLRELPPSDPSTPPNGDASHLLALTGGSSPSSPRAHVLVYTPSLLDRRLELNELIGFFCGLRAQRTYEVCLSVLIVGALWAYGAVFAGSMAVHLPISAFLSDGEVCGDETSLSGGGCAGLYYLYLLVFAAIVVPVTCRELVELKWMMIALALFRFVSLGLMMITAVAALYSHPAVITGHSPARSAPYYSDMPAMAWDGLGVIFPIAVSSQLFHHSIPNLSFPLRPQTRVPHVFSMVLLTTFALYACLGICVGLYYGSSVQSVVSLSWTEYTGSASTDVGGRPAWATIIAFIIVLFPPIDVLSAFPLNCITLANNIMAAFVTPQQATQRRYILPFRLLASILPILGAFVVKDLSTILHYMGSIGVSIAFLFPAALQFYSLRAQRRGAEEDEALIGGSTRPQPKQVYSASAAAECGGGEGSALSDAALIIRGGLAAFLNSRVAFASVGAFALSGFVAVVVLSIIDR